MRNIIMSVEKLVNDRDPQAVGPLISPKLVEPQRRAIMQAVESWIDGMPPDGLYLLRSDIGRGALVPTGPERIQMHVNGTIRTSEARERGNVFLEFEALEEGGRRRWLLVGLAFPGQSQIFVGGLPPKTPYIVGVVALIIVTALIVILLIRRRRK